VLGGGGTALIWNEITSLSHRVYIGIKVNTVITSLTEIVYTKNRITNVCIYLLAAELKTAAHGSNS